MEPMTLVVGIFAFLMVGYVLFQNIVLMNASIRDKKPSSIKPTSLKQEMKEAIKEYNTEVSVNEDGKVTIK